MEGGALRPASRRKGSQLVQLAGSPSYFCRHLYHQRRRPLEVAARRRRVWRRRAKSCECYPRACGARPSFCVVSLLLWLACASAPKTLAAEKVGVIDVDGAIGPATASYISRSIEEAKAQNVQCLVIQLNTPGGLLDSTQKIVQSFLGSPVPIVV